MTKEIWINLPVKDVAKSRTFFTSIGFPLNPHYNNGDESACITVGTKNVVVMLFKEDAFKSFIQHEIANAAKGTEVLFSFDAENEAEVDEMAKKVVAAGGMLYSKPATVQGWMYGCAFIDLDGHRWNVLHMDMSKMPKQ